MSATDELRRMLDERGVAHSDHYLSTTWRDVHGERHLAGEPMNDGFLVVDMLTPEQAIVATLGKQKAKAHPYGYEPDTGAFDVTRCECGCLNDISATYCNDCGGEIEIDMNAEKEIYHTLRHLVFAEKHDDGSLEFDGKRYVAATLGSPTLNANLEQALSFMRIWISDDAHLGESELSAAFEKAEGLRKLDAIESAIAATLGGGECEFIIEDNMNESEGMGDVWFRCTNCNATFGYYADGWLMKENFCPNCGRKVKR